MEELKPCPFCGGSIRIVNARQDIGSAEIEVDCDGCGMRFSHTQYFAYSKVARVATNEGFFEAWNRRADE